MLCCRNEGFQEELWKRSFEFLKDHLSPEIVEKYGPKVAEVSSGDQGAGGAGGEVQAPGELKEEGETPSKEGGESAEVLEVSQQTEES